MKNLPLYAAGALAIAAGGLAFYLHTNLEETRALLTASEASLASTTASLMESQNENRQLGDALAAERGRNEAFEGQISDISGTVGRLDKLSRLDPELLQKYSKIYFLNENYTPSSLSPVDEDFRFNAEKDEEVHAGVAPHLEEMLEAAEEDGIELLVASSYRSFGRQGALKSSYVVRYGTGANAFSAEQGYSEHQLGTTVDLTTKEVGGSFVGFDQSEAFRWLTENAYRYGFILSYPAGNAYYQYEPWHWRFVGRELARDLHRDDKDFYDLDQREIDGYLVDIFE